MQLVTIQEYSYMKINYLNHLEGKHSSNDTSDENCNEYDKVGDQHALVFLKKEVLNGISHFKNVFIEIPIKISF